MWPHQPLKKTREDVIKSQKCPAAETSVKSDQRMFGIKLDLRRFNFPRYSVTWTARKRKA